MANNTPETVVWRSVKEEDHFRGGFASSKAAPRSSEAIGTISVQHRDALTGGGHRASRAVEFQDAIGRELRNLYDDVAAQPVPDRFLNLLNQLEDNVLHSTRPPCASGENE